MSDKIYEIPAEWRSAPIWTRRSTRRCTRARSRTRTRSGPMRRSACTGTGPRARSRTSRSAPATSRSSGSRTAPQRRRQLHRPPPGRSAASQTAIIWEGDDPCSRKHITYRELHDEVCRFANRAQGAGRQEGRPRHHLHADDPGGGLRDARLRAHRRDPLGGVRRLLAGQPRRPHRRLRAPRSSSPPTRACAAASKVPLKANVDAALAEGRAASIT